MKTLSKRNGILYVDVASEGKMILRGTDVVIEEIEDDLKNLYVLVTGPWCEVRLNFFDTDIERLLGRELNTF